MIKLNKRIWFIVSAITLILVLTTCLLLINNTNSYAGSWVAGSLDYIGSTNKCEYDIVISANLAEDHEFTALGFKVQLIGINCERNIFTTFRYLITFEIYDSNNKMLDDYKTDFKITKSSQILEDAYRPVVFESSVLRGAGSYKLKWYGNIKSNVDQPVSGEYSFNIR